MTGDMTSVPLRADDRWTTARMQQGRVLLDTDWNLNLDGPARDSRRLAADTIGPAGVPVGSTAFQVALAGGVLTVGAGTMWVDGLLARNPADLSYADQAQITPLPTTGTWVVYLDVFPEEVQAAEDPAGLLDPALDGIDTTTRTRVGWRVRTAPAQAPTCGGAALPPGVSTGRLDVVRSAAPVSPDPCAPPDDPRTRLPDGLLRIEVVDAGTEATARFAWSYADGSDAVAAGVAGTAVTLAPSRSVTFSPGDLVEVSTLARREDRVDHGPLFTVTAVTPQAGGDEVTLATASALSGNPPGTCLRRWDGETAGAAATVPLTLAGNDTGIAFTAGAGAYLVGDWWGVRVRGSAADAVETLTAAAPDGIRHVMAPLAVVDLAAGVVLTDCRPTFPPLTELENDCTCTVTAFPGDDLQAKLDALPDGGGELCLAAGRFDVGPPLVVTGKRRVIVTGVGPATVLAGKRSEAVLVATGCDDIEVTHLRVESALPGQVASPPGDPHLMGALSFLGCDGVRVHDCEVWCPDSGGRSQSCVYVTTDPSGIAPGTVEICGNRLEVGDQQVGILVASASSARVSDNTVALSAAPAAPPPPNRLVARQLGAYIASHLTDEAAGARPVDLPDGTSVNVAGPAALRRVVTDWAKNTSTRRLTSARTTRADLAAYATASILEPHQASIGRASASFLAQALQNVRTMAQGIVVAGSRAPLVRIDGNVVASAVEGVHVGVQARGTRGLAAGQVVIRDNTVGSVVPFFWTRQRHAFYVGSVAGLTMADNHARITRLLIVRGTTVDAVRIWGALGPWVEVRGLDLTGGFGTGLVVRDTGPGRDGRPSMHYVSDVLNADGARAVDLPQTFQSERCLP